MKRRTRHATRNLFGLMPRRRPAGPLLTADQVLGALRLSGKSALTIGLAALMLILIGLLVANFVGQVLQSARLENQRIALEAEVARMEAENGRLAGAVAFTESDVYVERVARGQLGYAREGDVVILPRLEAPTADPLEDAAPAATEGPPQPPPTPNWRLWWEAFFPAVAPG
ncbi:MAG TPA: septum formation initiator family protein [Chloroflexaceae bacterium]|nr:septum formation initiator family protein [Chloroflexaceae bacterium]